MEGHRHRKLASSICALLGGATAAEFAPTALASRASAGFGVLETGAVAAASAVDAAALAEHVAAMHADFAQSARLTEGELRTNTRSRHIDDPRVGTSLSQHAGNWSSLL